MALLLANLPHFHLSSLLTRNLVVKITHSLYSQLQLRAAYRRQLWDLRKSQEDALELLSQYSMLDSREESRDLVSVGPASATVPGAEL